MTTLANKRVCHLGLTMLGCFVSGYLLAFMTLERDLIKPHNINNAIIYQSSWGKAEMCERYYGEYHSGQPTGESWFEKTKITKNVAKKSPGIINWSAETKNFDDFDIVNIPLIPSDTPGAVGKVINNCGAKGGKSLVSIVIEVGMNVKRARKLISSIAAYHIDVPLTLFVYGDIVEEYPKLIKEWSEKYDVGIRCDASMYPGQWEIQNSNSIRLSIVSAERRLADIGLHARYILPPATNAEVTNVIKKRQLRLIQPTVSFPPKGSELTFENYHKFRDVEKTPKALKIINDGLTGSGGILSLDTDFADNYMISIFLLDYLYQTSGHSVVKLTECVR